MRRAFALFELIIVMSLLAFLACLALPTFKIFNQIAVSMELDTLCAHILSLQQQACMSGQACSLQFDPDRHTYSCNGSIQALPQHVRFGILPGVKGPPSDPREELKKPITFTDNTILFYPDHGIIKSGTCYVTDSSHSFLYALTIPVEKFSYVRRYVYQKSASNEGWKLLP